MADYQVPVVKLDTTLRNEPVMPRGVAVSDLTIIDLPAGAVGHTWLKLGGPGKAKLPVLLQGQSFHIEPPEKDGVFLETDQDMPGLAITFLAGITVDN